MNLHDLKYLEPKSILDCGSNVGAWSLEAKQVWPDAYVLMIEGNFECVPYLNATGLPYIIALLADKKKEVNFYQRKCGGTSTGDSLYRENTEWYSDDNVLVTVRETETLDGLLKNQTFDLIKLDLQSAELDALRGGQSVIANTKYILMEIPVDSEHEPYNLGAPTRKEVLEYMDGIGFKLEKILESICHPILRYEIQQDVLFIRK